MFDRVSLEIRWHRVKSDGMETCTQKRSRCKGKTFVLLAPYMVGDQPSTQPSTFGDQLESLNIMIESVTEDTYTSNLTLRDQVDRELIPVEKGMTEIAHIILDHIEKWKTNHMDFEAQKDLYTKEIENVSTDLNEGANQLQTIADETDRLQKEYYVNVYRREILCCSGERRGSEKTERRIQAGRVDETSSQRTVKQSSQGHEKPESSTSVRS